MLTRLDTSDAPGPQPRSIVDIIDPNLGRLGCVAIDRPVRGAASGGVRFAPGLSQDELAGLARTMTYKWALLHVPMGGAKAGITLDPCRAGCERVALMEAFGRGLAPLVQRGEYLPGVDLGTTLDDLRAIMRGAGRSLLEPQIDGSACTAMTVFESVRQAARFHGLTLRGLRVALEGFGKVGSALAQLLDRAGARVVALSTIEGALSAQDGLHVARLLALRQAHGDGLVRQYPGARSIGQEAIFTQAVDVVIPGARPHVIHAANAGQVQARLIVPISNIPITPDAETALVDRGIIVVPDFLANCGGILASAMLSAGFDLDDARRVVETALAGIVVALLRRAQREGRPLTETARWVAWRNHQAMNEPLPALDRPAARIARMLRSEGAGGAWRRLAWRIHQQRPGTGRVIRRAAARRFTDMTLGITLARAAGTAA